MTEGTKGKRRAGFRSADCGFGDLTGEGIPWYRLRQDGDAEDVGEGVSRLLGASLRRRASCVVIVAVFVVVVG